MKIDSRMYNDGAPMHYDADFHRLVETHLLWLREMSLNEQLQVEPAVAYKHRADLFGLLLASNVRPELHWLVMRLNDYTTPTQYTEERQVLMLPNAEALERLRRAFSTVPRKING